MNNTEDFDDSDEFMLEVCPECDEEYDSFDVCGIYKRVKLCGGCFITKVLSDVGLDEVSAERGVYTELITLPVGTEFYAVDGGWTGKISEREGVKYLEIPKSKIEVAIGEDYGLVIELKNKPESNL